MSLSRHAQRLVAIGAGASIVVLATASIASAHVTVTPSTTAAGAYSVLTFSVGHGCDGSPTTKVAVKMPEEIIAVTPTINSGWTVDKQMQKLATPVDDGHGGEYTERVAQVVYTAKTPLPDGFRDTFELSLKLPETDGEKLVFPVIQTCEKGQTDWTQTYEDGQDEPESPAPFIELTAADAGSGHGHDDDGDTAAAATSESSKTDSSGSDALGWVGIVLGALGLAAGGTALARSRSRA